MQIRYWLHTLLFTLLWLPAAAKANWLTSIQQSQRTEHVTEVTLSMNFPIRLQSAFTGKGKVWRATLAADTLQSGITPGANQFFEQQMAVAGIDLQPGENGSLVLEVAFNSKVRVLATPQQHSHRLTFLALDKPAKKLWKKPRLPWKRGADKQFAVQLNHSEPLLNVEALPANFRDVVVYHPEFNPKRLRVGFFATRRAAEQAQQNLAGNFPAAKVTEIGRTEHGAARLTNLLTQPIVREQEQTPLLTANAATPSSIDQTPIPAAAPQALRAGQAVKDSVLKQAQQAYLDQDWERAIALYTKASKTPELRLEALERLGVSREKNRQLAHAKMVYNTLMEEYPNTPQARRVRQRYNSLIGNEGRPELQTASARRSSRSFLVGHLSQFYRRHTLDIEGTDQRVPIDALFTDASITARRLGEQLNQEARIQLGHIQDFNSDRQPETFRLQRAHWEADHQASGLGIRIGRQSRNKAGILGRFDGLNAHYNWSDDVRVNLTAGYLVDSTFDGYSSERPFYGASLDLSLLDEKLQVSPFVIEQRRDGILDRRAVGAQSRWIHNQTFLSGLVDYDIYHKALNALQVSGTFTMNDRWRLSGAFDLRRSPYLTTSNALIGQRVDELSELEQTLIDIELGDIADDRTATTRYARFGIDGKLNDTWHFSADVSLSDFSSTDTSAGVLGFPAREDIYLSSQLRANNLFGEGSYGAVQLRHQDSDTSSSDSVYFNARFTMAEQWHMYARLLTSRRELKTTNRDQLQFRPSLRVDYNGFRRFRLEAEVGYDWQERETALDDLTTQGLFFRLGYRALFR